LTRSFLKLCHGLASTSDEEILPGRRAQAIDQLSKVNATLRNIVVNTDAAANVSTSYLAELLQRARSLRMGVTR